ncbi:molybdopterin-guanine dinucleotide biosynthesis protein B [Campylobacter ureolyticus]|jgi:molybdopterin-guanine dinucleotide biosynthesis protein B|uniref:Molybdopterin-guanine dinucleotide biosynthesis protein B n=1 Tax=Campylobacter ureolyticus TaxID=827 RepID=A0A9Q4PTG3_9BACT|nr:molybdopterin-guanine dinucleotide biosynthesis protein B [Campylobacter ureolyticus]MCZ6159789.1 molybdopterin-guanine dinucleotide biosynthesis protein B [Campylobacter ureolyticus]MCZ6163120.1 molybdopterin-guanine dinucleotide biosynthesis protein B [Campylobacter ureolyticus]MCZ6164971.1 molybdopterin-guanine dinucleotide biosynthesis protein B [Campylobacter ureolyticus]MCZ6167617.1 molybdopterin-guanine dinucleotide biosynthesis protein B [Campylobacter ureolyticus]MCZ6174462.1 molyb
MKRLGIAFSGPSNSGKTTLILKVAKRFLESNLKVAIIKHDPSDKAKFDVEGKDSYKFSSLGVDVVVTSPTRTTYFNKSQKDLNDIIKMIDNFDILIVEGLKTLPLPRISIFRDSIEESYLKFSNAIATNNLKYSGELKHFDINDDLNISKWILENAKKL